MDGYGTQMSDLRSNSQIELPFNSEKKPSDAIEIIESYKIKIQKAKEREMALANGLAIFGIPSSEHKDLTSLTKDVDLLSQIWTITVEWKQYWDEWKNGQFNDLNAEEMETVAGGYSNKVAKLDSFRETYAFYFILVL